MSLVYDRLEPRRRPHRVSAVCVVCGDRHMRLVFDEETREPWHLRMAGGVIVRASTVATDLDPSATDASGQSRGMWLRVVHPMHPEEGNA